IARLWRTVPIRAADEDDATAQLADHALLGTVPVFSVRAVNRLLDFLTRGGELLPLRYGRAEYMAYNVTRVIDALDEKASSIARFPSGNVMSIATYVFRSDLLASVPIFKIPQLPRAHVFVTDEFVSRVAESDLTGFRFSLLWTNGKLAMQNDSSAPTT
ncbi:MAG: imm11 family protein, partial [Gemmatimonadaceae bacterium]